MALNTDFTVGQILTAQQQNNFPRGLVSVTPATAASGTFTTIVTTITAPSFTAVANRYYRISYFEPVLQFTSGTVNTISMTLKIGGVDLLFNEVKISSATNNSGYLTTTKTLTAGATVITGHLTANGGGTGNAFRSATAVAQIVIEDLGSMNGTFVNGIRVSGKTIITKSDSIILGRIRINLGGNAVDITKEIAIKTPAEIIKFLVVIKSNRIDLDLLDNSFSAKSPLRSSTKTGIVYSSE